MEQLLLKLQSAGDTYYNVLIGVLRFAAPILAFILLMRCLKPLLTFRREPEIWAWLCLRDGSRLPITHWESVIGRNKRSDIVIDLPSVTRNHAVLTRYDDGSWTVADVDSAGSVLVNGKRIRIWALSPEDVISIGGVEMYLEPISRQHEQRLAALRTKGATLPRSIFNVCLLTAFQALCCLAFVLRGTPETARPVFLGFAGIMAMEWLLLLFYACIRRTSFEVESIAFFLCTIGMAAIAAVVPDEAVKQLIAMGLGLGAFLLIGWALRDLERAKNIRYLAGFAGIGLLVITLLFGQEYYGAKKRQQSAPYIYRNTLRNCTIPDVQQHRISNMIIRNCIIEIYLIQRQQCKIKYCQRLIKP